MMIAVCIEGNKAEVLSTCIMVLKMITSLFPRCEPSHNIFNKSEEAASLL